MVSLRFKVGKWDGHGQLNVPEVGAPDRGRGTRGSLNTRMPSAKTWEGFSLVYLGSAGQQ